MPCGLGLGFLPATQGVLTTATFVTSYIIATVRNDTIAVFPYISDTGTITPESCIFGELLTISAFITLLVIFVRYKLVQALDQNVLSKRITRLNVSGLVLGLFTSLGLTMVANFQETSIEPVHLTGATLVFGVGVVYAFLQTGLSYTMYPDYNGLHVCRWRLAISLISCVGLLTTYISAVVSLKAWNSWSEHDKHNKLHWESSFPGYAAHIVSTVSEWLMAISFMVFFFTYIRDFQKLSLEVVTHLRVRHLDEVNIGANETTRLIA